MKITVNGKERETEPCSLLCFLKSLNLNITTSIVEHNYKVVHQDSLSEVMLKDRDNLEILSFVGGG